MGGAAELAEGQPAMRLVPEDAPPAVMADAVVALHRERPAAAPLDRFTVDAMAARYEALYARSLRRSPRGAGCGW